MRARLQALVHDLALRDPKVVLVIGDVGGGLYSKFQTDFPARFLNVGLCEQTMIGVVAGLALAGWRPLCYSFTPFLIERAFEQVKLDIHQQQLPVGLIGYSDDGSHGVTHSDVGSKTLIGLFPQMDGYFPETQTELDAVFAQLTWQRPFFIRVKNL